MFYHIYAGKDQGANFRVYLKAEAGSTFYNENPSIMVAGGYIGKGEYRTETRDFTSPAGYKELCVSVNAQEECGFKQVSTSFAVDYVQQQYLKEQASKTDIKTERECVGGSSSMSSVINPNLEEGANDAVNPSLYNNGIIRICATDSPGKGTDTLDGTKNSRWRVVGYCGETKLKCWIDTDSVKDVIDITSIENETLKAVSDKQTEQLLQEYEEAGINQKMIDIRTFVKDKLDTDKATQTELESFVSDVNSVYDKVIFSSGKAELIYYRAQAYGKLAEIVKSEWAAEEAKKRAAVAKPTEEPVTETPVEMPGETNGNGGGTTGIHIPAPILDPLPTNSLLLSRLNTYLKIIDEASQTYNIDVALIKAIISQENDAKLIGTDNAGSWGLMQVSKAAANQAYNDVISKSSISDKGTFNPSNFDSKKEDARANIHWGTAYYKYLYDHYHSGNSPEDSKRLALAAYNSGIGNIDSWCKDKWTQECVSKLPVNKDRNINVALYISNVLGYEESFSPSDSSSSSSDIPASSSISSDVDNLIPKLIMTTPGTVAKDNNVGGIILEESDIRGKSIANLQDFIKSYKTGGAIIIAADVEGGQVNRLKSLGVSYEYPSLKSLGDEYSVQYAKQDITGIIKKIEDNAKLIRDDMGRFGFNLNLAPVVDVSSSGLMYTLERSSSGDSNMATRVLRSYYDGWKRSSGKVGMTLKHFPGYGNNAGNTDTNIVKDSRGKEDILNNAITFTSGRIDGNADAIMMSSVIYTNLDKDNPAVLSSKVVSLARIDFDGLIITDDLSSLTPGVRSCSQIGVDALNAGNDVLLIVDDKDVKCVIDGIKNAAKTDSNLREKIKEASGRIDSFGIKYN